MSLKTGTTKEVLANFYITDNILNIGKCIVSNIQKSFVLNKLAAMQSLKGYNYNTDNFTFSLGYWTQGLVRAKQGLYHWVTSPACMYTKRNVHEHKKKKSLCP